MISKLYDLGIQLKGKTSGSIKTTCPQCSETRKNKSDKSLSVDISEGLYNCHNCGWSGSTKETKMEKKNYTVPVVNNSGVSDKVLEWFKSRGISKSTVMRFKISESEEWMPQLDSKVKCINFNYFREDKLVNIKFRDAKKNFKLVKDAELIFYGLDLIKDSEEAVICEGEMDALSFYEAGVFNVISVPNGASKGTQKLDYLDNCWEYFQNKTKIILATDNDEPGRTLLEELARRLGKERCFLISYPEGCKDANDVLVKLGVEELKKVVYTASEYPLEGIKTVADFEDRVDDIYLNGYPKGQSIGYDQFDNLLTFRGGEFTTATGIPGSGKSEFIDQIMIRMSQFHSWKWGVFSAENQPEELHFAKIAEKYIGKSFYSNNREYQMTPEQVGKAKLFINEHFFFVNIEEKNLSLDGLIAKCRELVLRKGINGFLIDPWNYVEHKIPTGYTETQYISEALTKISRLAKLNDIHIIIVAHPTKIQKEKEGGRYKVATLYDIAGSAHWFNKTDNGLSVYRDFETGVVDVHVQKVRFKFIGKIGMASFEWDRFTGRYTQIN
jgi:twinkle protein